MNDCMKERLAGLSKDEALDFDVLGRSEIAVKGLRSVKPRKRLFWTPLFGLCVGFGRADFGVLGLATGLRFIELFTAGEKEFG